MNYAWARDFTLELIDQYSVAGDKVAVTYNNQADYLHKIPRLLDDGATLCATGRHRIRAVADLGSLEHRLCGRWELYTLPADCWQIPAGGILRQVGDRLQRYHRYRRLGQSAIGVPAELDVEGAMVEYFRYPALLGTDPAEDAELDNTPVVQMALPYYAAARLVMLDNSFAYAALMNEFEGKLAAGGELPHGEWETVEDDYGTDGWEL